MTSSSTGSEHRVGELRRGVELLELVAEVRAEELVHRREHLGPRAVVPRQRQQLVGLRAPVAEHADVRVPEPVDRLELVADEEQLRGRTAQEVDELGLELVRVLELVDHDRPEPQRLLVANLRVVAEQVARRELEVLEVERGLARLRLRVRVGEAQQQLLQEVAVARRRLVERGLLDRAARLLVRRGALAGRAEAGQLHQPVGTRVAIEQRQEVQRVAALRVGRGGVVRERARRVAQLVDALGELRPAADVEPQLPPGRAQRLVDAREHPPQPARAVRREQPQPVVRAVRAELGERLPERLAAEHGALALVELAEARVEPGRERVRLQQPRAEAVDGRDPRAVELAREVRPSAVGERMADARAQLAGSAARVGDDEDRVDVEPAVDDGADEPLDEHGGLPRSRAGGDEDLTGRLDRRELLLVHALTLSPRRFPARRTRGTTRRKGDPLGSPESPSPVERA